MRSNEDQQRFPGAKRPLLLGVALLLGAACSLLGGPTLAQPAPARDAQPTDITILTSPADAHLTLKGRAEVAGTSPLDLPSTWAGRYSVTIDAFGHSTAQGILFIPPRGGRPTALSEPPRLTGGLLIRSLNFPGLPALSSQHTARGVAFLAAGTGGAAAMARDHFSYRNNLGEQDTDSQDRAADFHYARNRWAAYTGAVWGLSALDYILRPRMDLIEATPSRITLGAPRLRRGSVVVRSLLVPGAGQEFANRRGRAFFWLSAALASGAAYVIADESHHRIATKVARAESLLVVAIPAETAARQADVSHFVSREQTSRDLTHGLRNATIAIYVANVLDAVLLPLSQGESGARKVSLSAPLSPTRASLALSCRF